ncbi:hypothetical protein FH972_007095 [Carpinus fangiana]|uniref:Uncharacterized protein n=1 Tax=Carpinus fangiana TaxID=176857 RepID=A0A5N6QUH9_9ROSI|nr:hypothetical protein FH972_007095 [Carpinus fangiana]
MTEKQQNKSNHESAKKVKPRNRPLTPYLEPKNQSTSDEAEINNSGIISLYSAYKCNGGIGNGATCNRLAAMYRMVKINYLGYLLPM